MRTKPLARLQHTLAAAVLAALVSAGLLTAQSTAFNESYEGEIWELQTPSLPALEGGYIIGVTFADGNLYSADNYLGTILAYDQAGQPIDLPDADWRPGEALNELSPIYGMVPSELSTVPVQVNGGAPIQAVMVSDSASNRVFAFTSSGEYLFTLAVGHPGVAYPRPLLNGMAATPGASFVFVNDQPGDPTLALSGAFAVAWPEYVDQDHGAAVVYRNQAFTFNSDAGAFAAVPVAELTGSEGDAGHMMSATGVAFDSAGNLYAIDSWTERVHAYGSSFDHLFTFGTDDPLSPGTAIEFNEPFGLTYWPSANGDRLMIADMLNNRVVIYRPNLAAGRLDYLFSIDGLGTISGFPHSVAVDTATNRLVVSDSYDPVQPKLWMFRTAALAAFDLQVYDGDGEPARSVCAGSSFDVRFSLTVPENHAPLQLVTPQVRMGGNLVAAAPVGFDVPAGTPDAPVLPRHVLTYTYSLTAPEAGTYRLEATATASSVSLDGHGEYVAIAPHDISGKAIELSVGACPAGNEPPAVAVTPPPNAGWTRVEPPSPEPLDFAFTLAASDDRGVSAIQYRLFFANQTSVQTVSFDGSRRSEQVVVPLTNPGFTLIEFSALDNDGEWSEVSSAEVRLDNSEPGVCFAVPFNTSQVNPANQRWWNTASVEIPFLLRDAHDLNPQLVAPLPAGLNVDRLVFTDERANQAATLVVRDHVGYQVSVPSTTGPNPCSGFGGSFVSIDRTGPSVASDTSDTTPFVGPLTVTLSGHDNPSPVDGSSSGLRGIEYRLGSGPWQRVDDSAVAVHLAATTRLEYRAYDWAGNTGATVTRRYVIDNRLPVVTTPLDQVSQEGATVSLAIAATDPDGDLLQFSATGLPPGLSVDSSGVISGALSSTSAGTYRVVVTVFDGSQGTVIAFSWRVDDVNAPPVCAATATPANIWPPNHKAVYVSLSGITDPEGRPVTVRFTSILQDEPTDSAGQGNTRQDGGIEQNGARAWIRAERSGTKPADGRVYVIGYTATDAGGASCTGVVQVDVPHDQGKGPAVLSPGRWNSITGQPGS